MSQIVPISVPLTNGVARSFGHVRLNMGGLDFTGGFQKIARSRTRKREMVMSNSPDPVAKTLGENEYKCSAVLLFDWYMNFIQTIQNTFGPGYGDQPFTIFITYVGANLVPYTDIIIGCTIDTTEASDESGSKQLTREIDFNPLKILFGGLEDLADPLLAQVASAL